MTSPRATAYRVNRCPQEAPTRNLRPCFPSAHTKKKRTLPVAYVPGIMVTTTFRNRRETCHIHVTSTTLDEVVESDGLDATV